LKYFALIIEIIGILCILAGIFVELKYKARFGLKAITVGSFFIAIGG